MEVDSNQVAKLLADMLAKDPAFRAQVLDRVVQAERHTLTTDLRGHVKDFAERTLSAMAAGTTHRYPEVDTRVASYVNEKIVERVLYRVIAEQVGKTVATRVNRLVEKLIRDPDAAGD